MAHLGQYSDTQWPGEKRIGVLFWLVDFKRIGTLPPKKLKEGSNPLGNWVTNLRLPAFLWLISWLELGPQLFFVAWSVENKGDTTKAKKNKKNKGTTFGEDLGWEYGSILSRAAHGPDRRRGGSRSAVLWALRNQLAPPTGQPAADPQNRLTGAKTQMSGFKGILRLFELPKLANSVHLLVTLRIQMCIMAMWCIHSIRKVSPKPRSRVHHG